MRQIKTLKFISIIIPQIKKSVIKKVWGSSGYIKFLQDQKSEEANYCSDYGACSASI